MYIHIYFTYCIKPTHCSYSNVCCNTPQQTATHSKVRCNKLRQIATHTKVCCNTLRPTATQSKVSIRACCRKCNGEMLQQYCNRLNVARDVILQQNECCSSIAELCVAVHVAVCCRVLQCVAVCLQRVAECCSVLQCVCSVLQSVAVCCSVSQCVAVCGASLQLPK